MQIVTGSITLNPVASTFTSTAITPPAVSGKTFKLVGGQVILDVQAGFTTTVKMIFGVSNVEQVATKGAGALLIDDELVALAFMQNSETTTGLVTSYLNSPVEVVPYVPDEVYLNDTFYVNLMTGSTNAPAGDCVVTYRLILEEVKTTTKTQEAIILST